MLTFDELLRGAEVRDDNLMLDPIHQDVLRLDVPMRDGQHEEVVQSSEDLIGIYLDQDGIDFSLLDDLVQIIGEVIHNDVEVLVISLIGEETVLHDEVVGVVQHFQDLVLTILIFFILEHLLYCYLFASGSIDAEVDYSEGSLSCDSLHLVFGRDDFGFWVGCDGGIDLRCLIWLGLHVFIDAGGFVWIDFEVLPLRVGILGNVLGVDIDEFRL